MFSTSQCRSGACPGEALKPPLPDVPAPLIRARQQLPFNLLQPFAPMQIVPVRRFALLRRKGRKEHNASHLFGAGFSFSAAHVAAAAPAVIVAADDHHILRMRRLPRPGHGQQIARVKATNVVQPVAS